MEPAAQLTNDDSDVTYYLKLSNPSILQRLTDECSTPR